MERQVTITITGEDDKPNYSTVRFEYPKITHTGDTNLEKNGAVYFARLLERQIDRGFTTNLGGKDEKVE